MMLTPLFSQLEHTIIAIAVVVAAVVKMFGYHTVVMVIIAVETLGYHTVVVFIFAIAFATVVEIYPNNGTNGQNNVSSNSDLINSPISPLSPLSPPVGQPALAPLQLLPLLAIPPSLYL
jgi:hypothetical protein